MTGRLRRAWNRAPMGLRVGIAIVVAGGAVGSTWIAVRTHAVWRIREDGGSFSYTPPATTAVTVFGKVGHGALSIALIPVDTISLMNSTNADRTLA